jgi:cytidine deaminase
MRDFDITVKIVHCAYDSLSAAERSLIDSACAATRSAYCPYSGFSVGAAVRLADGTVVCGSNQENVAFPSGLCAERTAIFAACAQHPESEVRAVAVAAFSDGEFTAKPISPCGACRQVLLEAEKRSSGDVRIYLFGSEGVYIVGSARDLLPLAFDSL